jgi:GH24 family phage-related lysozyme (muramidase)
MRAIRDLVTNYNEVNAKDTLQKISDNIVSMKRLWIGKNLDGLLKRRDKEAELVKSCIG